MKEYAEVSQRFQGAQDWSFMAFLSYKRRLYLLEHLHLSYPDAHPEEYQLAYNALIENLAFVKAQSLDDTAKHKMTTNNELLNQRFQTLIDGLELGGETFEGACELCLKWIKKTDVPKDKKFFEEDEQALEGIKSST